MLKMSVIMLRKNGCGKLGYRQCFNAKYGLTRAEQRYKHRGNRR
jgi:hypothetical protein